VSQLAIPLYFKFRENNFLEVQSDKAGGFMVIGLVAVQLFVFKLQSIYGPRWFVPKACRSQAPNTYDYSRKVPAEAKTKSL
jgi:hypothetical protein